MMTPNLEELGRRAVACKRWQWMPGMLSERGLRVTRRDSDGYVVGYYEDLSYIAECVKGSLPDLSDPATLGCVLALVRKAHRDPRMFVEAYSFLRDKWRCVGVSFSSEWVGPNEAEALVAALEAAR
jgi:hypothetical protein